jgi:hypothetical protein
MAHPRETRERLRRLYVFDNQPLETAALQCNVSISTARRWRDESIADGDNWERARAAQLLASDGVEATARAALAGFLTQYQACMDELATCELAPAQKVGLFAQLADSYTKIVSASRRVLPETDELAVAMDVVRYLAGHVRDHHAAHAPALLTVLESFQTELGRIYG